MIDWMDSPYVQQRQLTIPNDPYNKRATTSKSGAYNMLPLNQIRSVAERRGLDPYLFAAMGIKETSGGKSGDRGSVYHGPDLVKRMGSIDRRSIGEYQTLDDALQSARRTATIYAHNMVNSLNRERLSKEQQNSLLNIYYNRKMNELAPVLKNMDKYAFRASNINAGIDIAQNKLREAMGKGKPFVRGITMFQGTGIDPVTKANNAKTDAYGKHVLNIRNALINQGLFE